MEREAARKKAGSTVGKKRKIALVSCLCLLLIILSTVTYAWLQRDVSVKNKTIISDFKVTGFVYFVPSNSPDNTMKLVDLLKEKPYSVVDNEEAFINVNLTDENAGNYIGNLRFVIKYEGSSPAYIRLRLLEQWSERDVFIETLFPKYNIPATNDDIFLYGRDTKKLFSTYQSFGDNSQSGTSWFDNRDKDFCYYYNAPVYPYETSSEVYMLLLNGISKENIKELSNNREGVEMRLMLEIQAVQPNRYREFFKIDVLPWNT